MLDIKFVRENPEKVAKAARDKGIEIDINHVLEIDEKFRELSQSVQKLREERNQNTSQIKGKPTDEQLSHGREIKERLEKEREEQSIAKTNIRCTSYQSTQLLTLLLQ